MISNSRVCNTQTIVCVALFLTISLFSVFTVTVLGEDENSTFDGWQIENYGGNYSEANSTFRLSTPGGTNCPSITLYKQISPTTDFSFSCQIQGLTMESCAIVVRSELPMKGDQGFNLEFGHYGAGMFILSRFTEKYNWTYNTLADGEGNTWYTMRLNVIKDPFEVVAEVFDDTNQLLGSFSAVDMSNLTFEDIKYIGLIVWGFSPSDYLFRNIASSFNNPSYLSISTESFSTTAGSAVNVIGTLYDSNCTPFQNELIILSYTFEGANSWIPISSGFTNKEGQYNIQWINTASGAFTLKVDWHGNENFTSATNTTTLSFLPIQNNQLLYVESNSTVTSLGFNSTTSELTFVASGPSGTAGYVKVRIAKSLVSNIENVKVFLDGNQLDYEVTSITDAWLLFFSYSHSTHQVSINLAASMNQTSFLDIQIWTWIIVVIIPIFVGTCTMIYFKKQKR